MGDRRLLIPRDRELRPDPAPIDELRTRAIHAPDVVRYQQSFWIDSRSQDARGALREVDLFLRIGVMRPEGADGEARQAGVVYKLLGSSDRRKQEGVFARRLPSGEEEWQVRLCLQASSPGVVPFFAWYDDGRGGVFYDDNARQLHVVLWKEGFEVVRHEFEATNVELTDAGVRGTLSVLLADLEYHKEVGLVWTTDGWKTHQEFGTGPAAVNMWHWVRDAFEGFQQWQIVLDVPGSFDAFEYAIVYRHGAVQGAVRQEFWADNGHRNFVVRRGQGSRP
ncbi:MAG: hypothetical protein HY898_21230 [Deltaproteobacteria bacterium]|nr:hypothetical protein [Deltaproteobacteria bacterium]